MLRNRGNRGAASIVSTEGVLSRTLNVGFEIAKVVNGRNAVKTV
jgi:hypothetical protein